MKPIEFMIPLDDITLAFLIASAVLCLSCAIWNVIAGTNKGDSDDQI